MSTKRIVTQNTENALLASPLTRKLDRDGEIQLASVWKGIGWS